MSDFILNRIAELKAMPGLAPQTLTLLSLAADAQRARMQSTPKQEWRLPDPPTGYRWHRDTGWTQDMLPGKNRPLLVGDTGEYEYSSDGKIWRRGTALLTPTPATGPCVFYRTTQPLPQPEPEPQWVPLEPADVPPGSVIRGNGWHESWSNCFVAILETSPTGIYLNRQDTCVTWEALSRDWQIKRPGEDWQPCRKEVQP